MAVKILTCFRSRAATSSALTNCAQLIRNYIAKSAAETQLCATRIDVVFSHFSLFTLSTAPGVSSCGLRSQARTSDNASNTAVSRARGPVCKTQMFTAVAPAITATSCKAAQNRYFGIRMPMAPETSRMPVT